MTLNRRNFLRRLGGLGLVTAAGLVLPAEPRKRLFRGYSSEELWNQPSAALTSASFAYQIQALSAAKAHYYRILVDEEIYSNKRQQAAATEYGPFTAREPHQVSGVEFVDRQSGLFLASIDFGLDAPYLRQGDSLVLTRHIRQPVRQTRGGGDEGRTIVDTIVDTGAA